MKRAKIALTAIAMFSVIGGALAFKAAKRNGNLYCSTRITTICPVRATTTVPGQGTVLFCTTLPTAPCTTTFRVTPNI